MYGMVSYDTIHTYDIRYLPLSRESTMDVSEREDITHHCGSIESIDSRARLYEPEEDRPSLATHEKRRRDFEGGGYFVLPFHSSL